MRRMRYLSGGLCRRSSATSPAYSACVGACSLGLARFQQHDLQALSRERERQGDARRAAADDADIGPQAGAALDGVGVDDHDALSRGGCAGCSGWPGHAEMPPVDPRDAGEEARQGELPLVQRAAVAAQVLQKLRLAQQLLQCGCDSTDVAGLDEARVHAVAQHRGYLAHGRAHHGDAVRQRFQDHERQAFVVRGQHQHVGLRHQLRHLLLVAPALERDHAAQPEGRCLGLVAGDVAAAGERHLQPGRLEPGQRQRVQTDRTRPCARTGCPGTARAGARRRAARAGAARAAARR